MLSIRSSHHLKAAIPAGHRRGFVSHTSGDFNSPVDAPALVL